VEVLAPVAPLADVHAADLADGADRALHTTEHDAELGEEVVRDIAEVAEVLSRLEDDHDRKASRPESHDPPVLTRPDVVVVRGLASSAIDAALAEARFLLLDRREQVARLHFPVEWERVPLLDRRHPQRVLDPLVELFGSLRHEIADAN
jgi:hypothetical protein